MRLVWIVDSKNIGDDRASAWLSTENDTSDSELVSRRWNIQPAEEKNGGYINLGPKLGVEFVDCNYGNDDDGDVDEDFNKAACEKHDIEVDTRAQVVVGPEALYWLTVSEIDGFDDDEPHRGDCDEYVGSKAVSWCAKDASVEQQNGDLDGVEYEEGDGDGDEDGL
jgi:hypothetical protein